MKIKYIIITFLLIALCIPKVMSATWTTVSYGYWQNPYVWSGGVVPPYTSSYTFLIRQPVAFDNDLYFNTGAFIVIDSMGGLCGHHNITMNTGTFLNKYGILEADTLFIPGGQVECYLPGDVILTLHGIISNGGSFGSHGCSVIVGQWFDCRQPLYAFTLGMSEVEMPLFELFPNPTNGYVTVNMQPGTEKEEFLLEIYNMQGILVMQRPLDEQRCRLDMSGFVKGIYVLIIDNISTNFIKKIIKQ